MVRYLGRKPVLLRVGLVMRLGFVDCFGICVALHFLNRLAVGIVFEEVVLTIQSQEGFGV